MFQNSNRRLFPLIFIRKFSFWSEANRSNWFLFLFKFLSSSFEPNLKHSNVSKTDSFPIRKTAGSITFVLAQRIQSKPVKKIYFSIQLKMNATGQWTFVEKKTNQKGKIHNVSRFVFSKTSLNRSIAVKLLTKIRFHRRCQLTFSTLPVRISTFLICLSEKFKTLVEQWLFFCFSIDYPHPAAVPQSAGENNLPAKVPSRRPSITDSVFEYLCRSIDNDYVPHPTDCKRYAYCANGKKRDIQNSSCAFVFWFER